MNRQEKIRKKQERSLRRIQKRQEKDKEKVCSNRDLFERGGFSNIKRKNGTWWEDGKLMQVGDTKTNVETKVTRSMKR